MRRAEWWSLTAISNSSPNIPPTRPLTASTPTASPSGLTSFRTSAAFRRPIRGEYQGTCRRAARPRHLHPAAHIGGTILCAVPFIKPAAGIGAVHSDAEFGPQYPDQKTRYWLFYF